jgi:hypothetical protein
MQHWWSCFYSFWSGSLFYFISFFFNIFYLFLFCIYFLFFGTASEGSYFYAYHSNTFAVKICICFQTIKEMFDKFIRPLLFWKHYCTRMLFIHFLLWNLDLLDSITSPVFHENLHICCQHLHFGCWPRNNMKQKGAFNRFNMHQQLLIFAYSH